MPDPILSVVCEEPEATVIRHVYPLEFTKENLEKLVSKALEFPTLYGKEIVTKEDIYKRFFTVTPNGLVSNGVFYVVDDFVGLFYMTDFAYGYTDALAHYAFFDRRHKGRVPLVRAMLKYVFDTFKLHRLSAEVPLYTVSRSAYSDHKESSSIHFIIECGFIYEGKRRSAAKFKETWFDINLYGILKVEVMRNGRPKDSADST